MSRNPHPRQPPADAVAPSQWASDDVEAGDALAYWADVVCDTFVGVSVCPGSDGTFQGGMNTSVLEDVRFAEVAASAQQVARTRRLIARDDEDVLLANIQLRGSATLEQDGAVAVLTPGTMAFIDSTRPYVLDFPETFSQLVVKVPRARLSHRSLNGATAVRLDTSGPGRVVADFLVGINRLRHADPRAAADLMPHAVDLLDTTVSWAVGTKLPTTSTTALTRQRVHQFVRRHATNPGLDATTVAAGCGVSRRTMYRALAENGESLTELIRRLRVSHAQRLLAAHPRRALATVARECGFGGETQLYRAFKAVTGRTPGAHRSR
ncbi:helix-turn-helix domain-containing protein [Streptomyces sp. NPDC093516]|uniref:AraC-like ligand-binding domain-containing protein n=1 Tax=Streptomyces sp. NPDC093516 TaxID=3155304 RepID=UPI00343AFF1F